MRRKITKLQTAMLISLWFEVCLRILNFIVILASTQSTFLKFFRCSWFSEFDSNNTRFLNVHQCSPCSLHRVTISFTMNSLFFNIKKIKVIYDVLVHAIYKLHFGNVIENFIYNLQNFNCQFFTEYWEIGHYIVNRKYVLTLVCNGFNDLIIKPTGQSHSSKYGTACFDLNF